MVLPYIIFVFITDVKISTRKKNPAPRPHTQIDLIRSCSITILGVYCLVCLWRKVLFLLYLRYQQACQTEVWTSPYGWSTKWFISYISCGFWRGSMTLKKLSFETLQICSSHKRVSIPLRQLRWLVRSNDPTELCQWDVRFNLTRQANQGGSWLKPINWPPRLGFIHEVDNLSLWNRFCHRNTNNKSPTYCLPRDLKAC